MEKLTYSVEEVAKTLGIGRNTAYELINQGSILSITIGRRRLVPRHAVRLYLGLPAEGPEPVPQPVEPQQFSGQARELAQTQEVTYVITVRRLGPDERAVVSPTATDIWARRPRS